jgi:hypothetical protein
VDPVIKSPTEKTTLTEYDRQLIQGVPFLLGKELTITTANTLVTQKFPHGLGRSYRGAFVIRASALSFLTVLAPETETDPEVNISVVDANGAVTTLMLWVW